MNATAIQNVGQENLARGGEYVGSLISLSVTGVKGIPAQTILDRIYGNPAIPNDWAPSLLNHLSLYFNCMRELKRSNLDKFAVDETGQDAHLSFEDFGGFIVDTLYKRSGEKMPAAHKVLYKRRIYKDILNAAGEVVDRRFEDLEVDEGITLYLKRTLGDAESDRTGQSEFKILADTPISDYYSVFVRTLAKLFWQKRQEYYDGPEVSTLLLDMIKNKMHANTMNRSLYFLFKDQQGALEAIEREFSDLHEGIRFLHIPITRYQAGDPANKAFESVATSVEESMMEAAKALKSELDELAGSDAKTRRGTWADRLDKVVEFKKRCKMYRQEMLLQSDVLDSVVQKMLDTIDENL